MRAHYDLRIALKVFHNCKGIFFQEYLKKNCQVNLLFCPWKICTIRLKLKGKSFVKKISKQKTDLCQKRLVGISIKTLPCNVIDVHMNIPAGSTMKIIELRKEDRSSQSGKCDIPIKTFWFPHKISNIFSGNRIHEGTFFGGAFGKFLCSYHYTVQPSVVTNSKTYL